MEGGKQSGSSSLASELFGAKDSSTEPSSSSRIFGSIFPHPSKVPEQEVHLSQTDKKIDPSWITKTEPLEKNGEIQNSSTTSKDVSSYYEEQKVKQPFHYSSSIYYGGQDVYSRPKDAQNHPGFTTINKDGAEDDLGSASRGNWWQGSLYY